jgi:hypothetical protein
MDGPYSAHQVSFSDVNLFTEEAFSNIDSTKENISKYFLNNQQTHGHRSIIFGLRELNSTEMKHLCSNRSIPYPPITDKPFSFSFNYQLRVYAAGCYYLDGYGSWQSDEILVSLFIN